MDSNQTAIIGTFENLTKTKSRKEKEAILDAGFKSPAGVAIKEALVLANDPYRMFNVIAVEPQQPGTNPVPAWDTFTTALRRLTERLDTGNPARKVVEILTSTIDQQWNVWACRIINKDLRVGAGTKTINKVAGEELVREFLVALCEKYDPTEEGADNPRAFFGDSHIIERKLDGWRCCAHVKGGNVTFYGRSGKPIANTKFIAEDLLKLGVDDVVFDGEAMADTFAQSESILGSDVAVLADDTIRKLKYHIFDIIPAAFFFSQGKDGVCADLLARKSILDTLATKYGSQLVHVPWAQFDSTSLAQYEHHLELGYEGSILKKNNLPYGFSRTRSEWFKVKPVRECDLRICGFEEGTGDLSGTLGAILAEGEVSSPGAIVLQVKVKIGTKMSDALRAEIWGGREYLIGTMIEVGYQDLTQAKDSQTWSLRFPRLNRLRKDKVAA